MNFLRAECWLEHETWVRDCSAHLGDVTGKRVQDSRCGLGLAGVALARAWWRSTGRQTVPGQPRRWPPPAARGSGWLGEAPGLTVREPAGEPERQRETPCPTRPPLVSICLPHWQVRELATLCLRSIRRYTPDVPYEVIVVDNGSQDDSLEYLRSLRWIRLIERGEETPPSPPLAHATALDIGVREARGAFFLSMHIDVIVKREGWLRRLMDAIESDGRCAAAGTGKLETPFGLYAWWKQTMDTKKLKLWMRRGLLRDQGAVQPPRPTCPRDFCALYRLDALRKHGLSFVPERFSPGEFMYLNLVERGYTAAMIPVAEMRRFLNHVVHGTAGLRPNERRLRHSLEQRRTERRLRKLFAQSHVQALAADSTLDA